VLIVALALLACLLVGCGHGGVLQATGPALPASRLQDLHAVSDLQGRFEQDVGKPRLILLVSPT
jgi:hypothetical protein